MNKTMNSLIIGALALGSILGYSLANIGGSQSSAPTEDQKKILYWVAPMDANYRSDKPGKSPMGMDLIPVYEQADSSASEPSILISPAIINNIGVKIAKVQRTSLNRTIDTVGYVTPDDNKTSHIHVRTEGWIEKLFVKTANEMVVKGTPLFQIYSPQLVNAQAEYLQALERKNANLIKATANRLLALGMNENQIKTLRKARKVKERMDFYAPQDGIVSALNVGEGMFVKPGHTILTLADLSSVWVIVEIFEDQVAWVKKDQTVSMHLSANRNDVWQGLVDYVYPVVDPKSRTVKLRLTFDNPDLKLKPNMYSEISIKGVARDNIIAIPRQALIRTGRSERVILALGKGRFRPAEVISGMESGDWIEIVSGLNEDENIVTSGQFLIDSESSLDASLLRLQAPEKEIIDHSTMDHSVMPMPETKRPEVDHSEMDHAKMEGMKHD